MTSPSLKNLEMSFVFLYLYSEIYIPLTPIRIPKNAENLHFFCKNVSLYGNFFVPLQRFLRNNYNYGGTKTKI